MRRVLKLLTSAADTGSRRVSQRGRRRKPHASAAAHLPSVPIEAAVNMCLARGGFDLLRSAAFKQRMHAHIQRKLDVLRIPEYIQSIEVSALLNGCASALRRSTASAWLPWICCAKETSALLACSGVVRQGSCEREMLQVIEVELGSMVPAISNLRALPCPTAALWPQAVFDLDYGGLLQPSCEP